MLGKYSSDSEQFCSETALRVDKIRHDCNHCMRPAKERHTAYSTLTKLSILGAQIGAQVVGINNDSTRFNDAS